MYIYTGFTPVKLEFSSENEWYHFRDFLNHTASTMDHRMGDFVRGPRELNEHEKIVRTLLYKILESTAHMKRSK